MYNVGKRRVSGFMKSEIRDVVIDEIKEVFGQEGLIFNEEMLSMGVMDIGVDSLTYAVLVARLQFRLGKDPFTENPELGYPKLLGDFLDAYLGE